MASSSSEDDAPNFDLLIGQNRNDPKAIEESKKLLDGHIAIDDLEKIFAADNEYKANVVEEKPEYEV